MQMERVTEREREKRIQTKLSRVQNAQLGIQQDEACALLDEHVCYAANHNPKQVPVTMHVHHRSIIILAETISKSLS